MTAWDIHVAEVHQVLLNAGDSAAGYDAHVARVGESVGELLVTLPCSPHVSKRVDEFAQQVVLPHLGAIIGDTTAALDSTMLALTAYQEGDELMARRTRCEVAAITPPRAPGALPAG